MLESGETGKFWDELLLAITDEQVIPVVGPGLLTVQEHGRPVPLYRIVAKRLLEGYLDHKSISKIVLGEHRELNDAVCALNGRRVPQLREPIKVQELYPKIHKILKELLPDNLALLDPLRQLASITDFDLFVTTTPDDLLRRALTAVRLDGDTEEIVYAPKLSTGSRKDLPINRSSQHTALFYLFGKSSSNPFYAIHDEDALEFPYTWQADGIPERMLMELRTRDLLLIGCNFADWFARFFLRLSNPERLFSNPRAKKEFLVGAESTWDKNLIVFLKHFSQVSKVYPVEPHVFVDKLYQHWSKNHLSLPKTQSIATAASVSSGKIFISYHSPDFGAAQKFYEELNGLGGDVAWFDRKHLNAGVEWEKSILSAIQSCRLFLPLLSAKTELNGGFFMREWNEAAHRLQEVEKNRKFIIPIVIDASYDGNANSYTNVPVEFHKFQYGHAPGGKMSEALRDELLKELDEL